jgi:hypothetical protein
LKVCQNLAAAFRCFLKLHSNFASLLFLDEKKQKSRAAEKKAKNCSPGVK